MLVENASLTKVVRQVPVTFACVNDVPVQEVPAGVYGPTKIGCVTMAATALDI